METRNIVDAALQARSDAAIATVALQGACADELDRIAAARKALAAEQGSVLDVEQANGLLLRAGVDRTQAAEILSQATKDAESMRAGAYADQQAAAAIKRDLEAGAAALAQHLSDWQGEEAREKAALAARASTLDAREAACATREEQLSIAEGKLADERAAFNTRLDALKA